MSAHSLHVFLRPKGLALRLASYRVLASGIVLTLVVFSTAIGLMWRELGHAQQRKLQQLEMLASVMEAHATQVFESGLLALDNLAASLTQQPLSIRALEAQQTYYLQSLPFLRSLALVSIQGHVLASTTSSDRGGTVDLQRLLPGGVMDQRVMIGPWIQGRSLVDVDTSASIPSHLGFIPLIRRVQLDANRSVVVVAPLNPDALATYQQQLLEVSGPGTHVLLSLNDGSLLSQVGQHPSPAGSDPRTHVLFSSMQSAHKGSYGPLKKFDESVLGAWNGSSSLPLVTLVEQPYAATQQEWRASLRGPLIFMLLALVLIVLMTFIAWRNARAREIAQSERNEVIQATTKREQEQLALTRQLLESNPLPICMTDMDGRFMTVNQAWEHFMGLPRERVLGLRNSEFLPPQEAKAYDSHNERLLLAGGHVRYEERLHRPDGSVCDVQVTKVRLESHQGQPLGLLIVKMDITAFLAARDLAEQASRAKSEFMANISHELRTPLQSILGFSELGMLRAHQYDKLAHMFGDIHAAGERMLALVNNLLDLGKMDISIGAFKFERHDVRMLAQEVASELEPQLKRKCQALALQLGSDPLIAKVDRVRFVQVVRNVLANAVKFSPEDRPICITAALQNNSRIHLTVRDQGPGIPLAELETVFQAFVQSSQTSDGSGGSGLGLAICQKIMLAHGGSIYAANAPEGGAIFHIILPAAELTNSEHVTTAP